MPDTLLPTQASSSALPPSSPPVSVSTPPPAQTPTPNLSSPDTPHLAETPRTTHLQTPRAVFAGNPALRERAYAEAEGEVRHGLGLGSASGSERGSVDMGSAEDRKGKGKAKVVGEEEPAREEEDEEDEEEEGKEGLAVDDIQRLRRRLEEIEAGEKEGDGWAEREELIQIAKSLFSATDHLMLLEERLSAQKSTILTLQEHAKLSEKLAAMERMRNAAEMQSMQADIRALIFRQESETASGMRPRKPLDLDVGYHKELEAANKRLEMDNRLMAPRLADTQRQIDRLVNELRLLRPHVMLNTEPLVIPKDGSRHARSHAPPAQPYLPFQSQPPSSMPLPQYMPQLDKHRRLSKAAARTTMGDARAEHLLLAAKKVRAMRRADSRIGRLTLAELKRAGVSGPDGGMGYREGYGAQPESDVEGDEESEGEGAMMMDERRPSVAMPSSASKVKESSAFSTTPLLPNRAKRSGKRPVTHPPPVPQTPSRSRMSGAPPSSLPQTTPGGSNFNDLLRAAEMATRPPSPSDTGDAVPVLQAPMSTTRSTTTADHSHSHSHPHSHSRSHSYSHPHSHSRGMARGREDSDEDRGSPKRPRRDTWGAAPGTPLSHAPPMPLIGGTPASSAQKSSSSALDLLAQASQLDMTSNERSPTKSAAAPPSSASRGMLLDLASSPQSSMEEALGPAIDLTPRGGGSLRPLAPAPAPVPAPGPRHGYSDSAHGHGHWMHGRPAMGLGHAHRSSLSSHPPSGDDYPTDASLHTPTGRPRGSSPSSDSMYASSVAYPTPGWDSVFEEGQGEGSRGVGAAGSGSGNGEFASPSGKVVPGLGRHWHLTGEMPMKRVRSPYLKWTMEEDELLARAVAIHGEKWDLVSKGVPTRSYHQVRQRWLRKTGAFDKKQQAKGELQESGGSSSAGTPLKTSGLAQDDEE